MNEFKSSTFHKQMMTPTYKQTDLSKMRLEIHLGLSKVSFYAVAYTYIYTYIYLVNIIKERKEEAKERR